MWVIRHEGQDTTCFKCFGTGHLSKDCEDQANQFGRDCRLAAKAWKEFLLREAQDLRAEQEAQDTLADGHHVEQARLAAEQTERDRVAALEAEEARLAAEQTDRDRVAAVQAEENRLAAERDRLAAEQAERDRVAAIQTEESRLATERDRVAAEQAESDRVAAVHAKEARLTAELDRVAADLSEQGRLAVEQARIAAEQDALRETELARVDAEGAEQAAAVVVQQGTQGQLGGDNLIPDNINEENFVAVSSQVSSIVGQAEHDPFGAEELGLHGALEEGDVETSSESGSDNDEVSTNYKDLIEKDHTSLKKKAKKEKQKQRKIVDEDAKKRKGSRL